MISGGYAVTWDMFRIGYVYITYNNKYVNGGVSLILNLILNFRDLMLALDVRDIFVPVYHSGTKPFVILGVFWSLYRFDY